jgi:hypothetical protein
MKQVNRVLVEELLRDDSLSFREIARRAKCSDWSVRSIASQLSGDHSSDTASTEPLTLSGCAVGIGIAVLILGGLWFVARQPPPSSESM